jgi:ABC-type multidrug transport system fused ATPase/permease subunit
LKDETAFLKDVNVHFEKNKFYAVIGTVGSGKSSLISCIFDQMNLISGKLFKKGSIAVISQDPLLLNDTIQNNILFGKQ